jgi:hypothetical protein
MVISVTGARPQTIKISGICRIPFTHVVHIWPWDIGVPAYDRRTAAFGFISVIAADLYIILDYVQIGIRCKKLSSSECDDASTINLE